MSHGFENLPPELRAKIASIVEVYELENEMSDSERSFRRLKRLVATLPEVMNMSLMTNNRLVFMGHVERIVYHCQVLFGDDFMEEARRYRESLMNEDQDDDTINPEDNQDKE